MHIKRRKLSLTPTLPKKRKKQFLYDLLAYDTSCWYSLDYFHPLPQNPTDPLAFINTVLFEQLGPHCAVALRGSGESAGCGWVSIDMHR